MPYLQSDFAVKGRQVYLSITELSLLLEALDMLQQDYGQDDRKHPEAEAIERLENKLRG